MHLSQIRAPLFFTVLAAWTVGGCECVRDNISTVPTADAAVEPADAYVPPPPPMFPLNPGDKIKYPINTVLRCNESFGSCTEQSIVWISEYTIQDPGATLDAATNSWMVPAKYFWQVSDVKKTVPAEYQTLDQLWISNFGPWQEAVNATSPANNILTYRTNEAFTKVGMPDTFPFFDLNRWTTAAAAFDAYVKTLDPMAKVETQEAARKMEAGYLDPADPTLLHYVSIIYHRLGFVCLVQESVGPWDPAKPKNDSGFRNNQRDVKSAVEAPRVTRVGGTLQFCKCGTQAGNDCN